MDADSRSVGRETITTRASKRKRFEVEKYETLRESVPQNVPRTIDNRATCRDNAQRIRRKKRQRKIPEDCWVQCDKKGCGKWRKLSKSVFQILDVDAEWYCSMNQDPLFNSCEIAEEVSASREPYAYGMECGELVWAKMAGWTPWPAVICEDPENEWRLVEVDEDEDKVYMYHVIFLGKSKSRAWVLDDKITPYVRNLMLCGKTGHSANSGQGVLLTWAKREAESLLSSSLVERSRLCAQLLEQLETGKKRKGVLKQQNQQALGPKKRGRRPKNKQLDQAPTLPLPGCQHQPMSESVTADVSICTHTPASNIRCIAPLPHTSPPKPPSSQYLTIPQQFVLAVPEGNPLQPHKGYRHGYSEFPAGNSEEPIRSSGSYGEVPSTGSHFVDDLQKLELETKSRLEDVEKLLASMDSISESQDSQHSEPFLGELEDESQVFAESLAAIDNLLALMK